MKRDEGAASGRRATLLLALGAAVGLGLAVLEIVRPAASDTLGAGTVALINGQPLARDDYERTIGALSSDRRGAIDAAEKRRILDRLIDEELLLQHGQELGLVRRDTRVRGDLVAAVIDVVTSEAAAREPTAAELAAFYAESGDHFATPGRVRLRQVLVRVPPGENDDAARARAEQATARLRSGEDFATVAAELGDPEIAPLPDSLLPPLKLREYVGPTATRIALALPAKGISEPVRSSSGYHVLEMLERDAATRPPLADVDPEVRAEWKRRNADRALRDYLDELRGRARIVVEEPE